MEVNGNIVEATFYVFNFSLCLKGPNCKIVDC